MINEKNRKYYGSYILGIFIITLSIATSGYVYMLIHTKIIYGILIIPIVGIFMLGKWIDISITPIFLGMLTAAVCSMLVNYSSEYIMYNLKYILAITFSYCVAINIGKEKIFKWYTNAIAIIAAFSLLMYILVNIYGYIPNWPIIQTSENAYYSGYVCFINTMKHLHFRNYGAFWEPGVFASHLLIAMSLEILFRKKPRWYLITILGIALYTTKSTAGYLLFVLVLLMPMSKKVSKIYQMAIIGVFAIAVVLTIIFQNNIIQSLIRSNPIVFGELYYESRSTSMSFRIDSIIQNMLIFMRHPIFGASFGGADALYSKIGEISQTSTSTYLLAANGIGGIFYTLLMCKCFLNIKETTILSKILLFAMIIIIVNKEPHTFFTTTYIILFALAIKRQYKSPKKGNNIYINKKEYIKE